MEATCLRAQARLTRFDAHDAHWFLHGQWDNRSMNVPDPNALLDALDPDQRAVALQVKGPLAVLAGAGTGKTRAITYRIAYGVATGAFTPNSVLAVTFTRRAAFEMGQRLTQLGVPGVPARTFHSAALSQLKFFWPTAIGGQIPEIIPSKSSLVYPVMSRLGIAQGNIEFRDVVAEIEWAKVSMVDAERYGEVVRDGHPVPDGLSADEMATILRLYEDAKRERGAIDFEDVLILMAAIMQDRPDVARQVRNQYQNFVVDEFQDVSRLQHSLLDLWIGDRHDVCVVGDVAQTIYSFAGAQSSFLVDFPKKFKGAHVLELTRDYRSTPQIVDVANSVMLGTGKTSGAVTLSSQRPSGAHVEFASYSSDREEAEAIASKIQELIHRGTPAHDIAVLLRINAQSELYEEVFSARQIPIALQDETPFFDRESVRRAVSHLIAVSKSGQDASDSLRDQIEEHLGAIGWTPQAPNGANALERWNNLNTLIALATDSSAPDLAGFIEELTLKRKAAEEPNKEGVEVMTLHSAKGLEWSAVFMPGLSEGLLPISYAKTPEAIEEERRLLYVGITRARDILELSWARSRRDGDRSKRKRSRLLNSVWPQSPSAKTKKPAHAHASSSKQAIREFQATASKETLDLFKALRSWRSDVAKLAGKPPYTVFSDLTLRELATQRPKNHRELLGISGIGEIKADAFGSSVLAILDGETVEVTKDDLL